MTLFPELQSKMQTSDREFAAMNCDFVLTRLPKRACTATIANWGLPSRCGDSNIYSSSGRSQPMSMNEKELKKLLQKSSACSPRHAQLCSWLRNHEAGSPYLKTHRQCASTHSCLAGCSL